MEAGPWSSVINALQQFSCCHSLITGEQRVSNVSDKFVNLVLEDQSLKFLLRKQDVYIKDRKSLDVECVHSCFRNAVCLIHFLACILPAWLFFGFRVFFESRWP